MTIALVDGTAYVVYSVKIPYSDLILSPETCLGSFCSSDVSQGSVVFLKREILTPKSLKYRASKAAVNSIAKSVDIYLKQTCGDNAMCVSLHPGTVKTGLSQNFWGSMLKEKLFTPEFAAERLVQVANEVGLHGRGKCWDWDGKEISP